MFVPRLKNSWAHELLLAFGKNSAASFSNRMSVKSRYLSAAWKGQGSSCNCSSCRWRRCFGFWLEKEASGASWQRQGTARVPLRSQIPLFCMETLQGVHEQTHRLLLCSGMTTGMCPIQGQDSTVCVKKEANRLWSFRLKRRETAVWRRVRLEWDVFFISSNWHAAAGMQLSEPSLLAQVSENSRAFSSTISAAQRLHSRQITWAVFGQSGGSPRLLKSLIPRIHDQHDAFFTPLSCSGGFMMEGSFLKDTSLFNWNVSDNWSSVRRCSMLNFFQPLGPSGPFVPEASANLLFCSSVQSFFISPNHSFSAFSLSTVFCRL